MSSALVVGLEAGASGSYNLNASGVLICNSEYADYESIGNQGSGNFTQSRGTNNTNILYIGAGSGGNGTYSLNGGTLTCQQFQGGAGTSTLNLDGGLLLAAPGASSNFISGLSTLTVGNSATASYTQSSGSNNVGNLYLGFNPGASGSYNLNGSAVLAVSGTENVGYSGSGSFTQSGGTNTSFALYVGAQSFGSGNYTQSGGTNNTYGLSLGFNPGASGSYNLNGSAVLSVSGNEIVGYSGSGSFAQSGGTNNTYGLYLGFNPGAPGSYNLNGSAVLSVIGNENVGYSGSGSFTQSGGTNNAAYLQLGQMAGGSGTYNLNGGTLTCQQIQGGAGTSTFNFNGAVLLAATGASSNFMSGLTAAYVQNGWSYINTNGQNITIAQPLLYGSGGGSLCKIGAGMLTLTAANTYVVTCLNSGMLVVANGNNGSATGLGLQLAGGTLAAGPAGGTIKGTFSIDNAAPFTIAPGAALTSGYGTLNMLGGLATDPDTTLLYNLNLGSSLSTPSRNGYPIYQGDLINLGGANLNVGDGFSSGGTIACVVNPSLPGDYRLIADAGAITGSGLGSFTLPSVPLEAFTLSSTVDTGYIDLVVSGIPGASGGTWVSPVSGSWQTPTNWSCNPAIPYGGTVWFPGALSATITATLDGNQTAGALVFNVSTTSGYVLAEGSGGALTLGTSAGGSITVLGGSHRILAPITMAGNLTVSVTGGASLGMSGPLSEAAAGTSVTFTGQGLTTFSGTGTYTGNTNVYGGTLQINPGANGPTASIGRSGAPREPASSSREGTTRWPVSFASG